MYHGSTIGNELCKGSGVFEVALNERYAEGSETCCFGRVSDQCTYLKALFQQSPTQECANKPGGASNGDQAALGDQAEATLRRTSSMAASSLSMSLLLMKSSRALARDSLPDEVRGSEWIGTSST